MNLLFFQNIFATPVPRWGHAPFVSSQQFWRTYTNYEVCDKGYIKTKQLKNFLKTLFSEASNKKINRNALREFRRKYVDYMTTEKKQKWIPLFQLMTHLEMIERSILVNYRGRIKYSIADLMDIWRHYDRSGAGYMQKEDVEVLAFDLLTDTNQKSNPRVVRSLARRLSMLTGGSDGRIEFTGITDILPLVNNLSQLFPFRDKMSWEELELLFELQDKRGLGKIAIDEIPSFLKKITDKFGDHQQTLLIQEQTIELSNLANKDNAGVLRKQDLRLLLCKCRNQRTGPLHYFQLPIGTNI